MLRLPMLRLPMATALALALSAPIAAGAKDFTSEADALTSWASSLVTDPRALSQAAAFRSEGQRLSRPYAYAFTQDINQHLISNTASWLRNLGIQGCRPGREVLFMRPGFRNPSRLSSLSAVEKDFESGVIRVEVTACLSRGTAKAAMAALIDPEFRLESVPQLESSELRGSMICERTEGIRFLTDPVSACYDRNTFKRDDLEALFTVTVKNQVDHQPVYFFNGLTTTADLNGGVALHIISYARIVDAPSAGWIRRIAADIAERIQKRAIDALERRMR